MNATDGDDVNSGASPAQAVRSFEHAFRTFPSDAVVCMTGGEYFHGLDADGIQLTGDELAGKNMEFVLQSFGGSSEIAFTEDELRVDLGTGRITFVAGSARSLRFGHGAVNAPSAYPSNTTFLHTIVFASGTVDVSDVDLKIDASVGNPAYARDDDPSYSAPDTATVARGSGTLTGTPSYEEATRSLAYVGSGDRSAGDEIPPLVGRLVFRHDDGTVTVGRQISFAPGSIIGLEGDGGALMTSTVELPEVTSPAVVVTGSGTLEVSVLSVGLASDVSRLLNLESGGGLMLRDVAVEHGDQGAASASISNSGSGLLQLQRVEAGSDVELLIENEGSGTCHLGSSASDMSIEADLVNAAGAECALEAGTRLLGTIDNDGRLSVLRHVELSTTVDNTGTIDLEGDLTISGVLKNIGDIDLGAYTLAIRSPGPHQNDGRISGSNLGGGVRLEASTTISGDGELPRLRSVSGTHLVGASIIRGDVSVGPSAQLTLDAGEVDGSALVEGGSAAFDVDRVDALDLTGGTLTLQSDIVVGDYVQAAPARTDLSGHALVVAGRFERHSGTFVSGGGRLSFEGAPIQSFEPGPGLVLDHLRIDGTDVRLESGPLDVRESLVVTAGSKLLVFDFPLRLVGPQTSVRNDGEITTSVTGALTFAGPEGALQRISGSGLLGNVEIALDDEYDEVLVDDADVRQTGILTLTSGRLRLNAGSSYVLVSTHGVPLIRRNLGDGNGDGQPAGKAIDANTSGAGSFVSPEEGYNLEYFGALQGPVSTGAEFVSGRIVDFRVRITGSDTTPAALSLSGDLSFTGGLELAESAELHLGNFDLSATGSGRVHDVHGAVRAESGAFVVTGSSVSVVGHEGGPSTIDNIRIDSDGFVHVDAIRSVSGILEVAGGRVDLNLASGAAPSSATVGMLIVLDDGLITLQREIEILEHVHLAEGELDLDSFDLLMAAGSSFDASEASVINSDRDGTVIFAGDGMLSTGGSSLPRLRVALPDDSVLSLSGDVRIGELLAIESGTVDLSAGTLTLEAGRWELTGGRIEGTGAVTVAGRVEAFLEMDYAVPHLVVRGPESQSALVFHPSSSGRLLVGDRLSLQQGLLELGSSDLVVGRIGAIGVLEYAGGAFADPSQDAGTDASSGELVLADAELELADTLRLSNVWISGDVRFRAGGSPLLVERQITFSEGMLHNTDSTRVRLAENVRIVRRGPGTFARRPMTTGAPDLYYLTRGVDLEEGELHTGPEVPLSRTIRRLTIDAGAHAILLDGDATVTDTLRLNSGTLDRNGFDLRVGAGGTVHYDHSASSAPTFSGGTFQPAGAVRLVYSGTNTIAADDLTFPPDATVSELVVAVGGSIDEETFFVLHANRRIQSMTVDARNEGSGADLDGRTLIVNSGVRLQSGVIRSLSEAILEVGDSLQIASSGAVRGFVGVLARGYTDIDGIFDGHLLRTYGDVDLAGGLGSAEGEPTSDAEQRVAGLPNLEFSGTDQTFVLRQSDDDPQTVDEWVNRLVMSSGGVVRMVGIGHVATTFAVNRLELHGGVLQTDGADVRLPSDGAGYAREENAGSHVAGRVSRAMQAGQTGRFDFPVGSGDDHPAYRPLSITFPEEAPLSAGSVLTVGHSGAPAGGFRGLPLDGGDDVLIGDVSGFHWTVAATPELSASQPLTLGVVGYGFEAYSAARTLRLVRRPAGAEWEQSWSLEADPSLYNNANVSVDDRTVPFVQIEQHSAGIPSDPQILAIGIDAAQIDFARVQAVNLLGRYHDSAEVFIDDDSAAPELGFGQASAYFRVEPGTRAVHLVGSDEALIAQDTLSFEAGRDYVLAALERRPGGSPSLLLGNARAVPTAEATEEVSVGFYHGIPDMAPLSLRRWDGGEAIFSGVRFAESGGEYAHFAAENTGFDLVETASSKALLSLQAEFDGLAGETVTAFAAGYLNPESYGASAPVQLFFVTSHGRPISTGAPVAADDRAEVPSRFSVEGNYPNPFNPSTNVVVDLPESAEVTVELFDLLGRSVMRVRLAALAPGRQAIRIDASALSSGVYIYRVKATGIQTHVGSGKMTLVR